MANPFYSVSGTPGSHAAGSSSAVRTEFTSIQSGFDKLPALTASTAIVVNGAGTALTNTTGTLALAGNFATTGAFSTTLIAGANVSLTLPVVSGTLATLAGTETLTNKSISGSNNALTAIGNSSLTNSSLTIGSTSVALGATAATIAGLTLTSPTLTAPSLGNATAITINKLTLTAPATGSTLTIADGKTVTHNATTTFAGTDGKTLTLNATLTLAGTDSTTMTFPSTSATIARTDAANTFTGHQTIEGVTSTGATGTGKLVFDGTPTLVTPVLGTATVTTVNKVTITTPASASTLTIDDGKTLRASASLTLTGTDATVMTFPSTSATLARTDAANTFTGHQTIEGVTSTGATGTGNLVFSASPTFSGTTTDNAAIVNTTLGVTGAATLSSTLAVTGATTLTGGAASVRGVTGSVAENTLTTLFDMSGKLGTYIVSAQQTSIGDHMATLIQPTPGAGGITVGTSIFSAGAGGSASDVTFAISGTIVQAKRNTGGGTGTITWSATLLA